MHATGRTNADRALSPALAETRSTCDRVHSASVCGCACLVPSGSNRNSMHRQAHGMMHFTEPTRTHYRPKQTTPDILGLCRVQFTNARGRSMHFSIEFCISLLCNFVFLICNPACAWLQDRKVNQKTSSLQANFPGNV